MTLTKEETKNFEKFLASPFFNNGRNYLPLLNELKKYYPEFSDDKLTSENIYKKIYPGRKFNKQVMWNQFSELEKLAIEFLLQTALKNNKVERYIMLVDELSRRQLDKQIFKEIEKSSKQTNSVKLGKEYFYLKFNTEISKVEYWNIIKGRPDKNVDAIVKSTELLIVNLLVDLSVQIWNLNTHKAMYGTNKEINSSIEFVKSLKLKDLVDMMEKNRNEYASITNFYYNKIMSALDENEESYFFEMKTFFEENYDLFDLQEQRNTLISLGNYCGSKINVGNEKFLKILFEVNKFRIEKQIETNKNGKISKALYHQLLRTALSLGEIKWSEEFVKRYTSNLKKEHQKTMNALACGYIYYEKKEYDKSLQYLNKIEFIDLRDKLHVRILSAKAYYELNETELLFYYIDSSKHFIGNSTAIEKNNKDAYIRFFNFLNKLLICKENPDQNKLKELRENIHFDQSLRLRHKNWLLEKIDLLFN